MMWLVPESFNPILLSNVFLEHKRAWALACVLTGLFRIAALIINGKMPNGSPLIRLAGSIMGAGIFGAITGSLLIGPLVWGVATYSGLMVAEIVSSLFSASDVLKKSTTV